MKKFLLVLFAVLLFAIPVIAQEEDNPVVLTWEDDIENVFIENGHSGTFYNIPDLGIKLLVPEGLEPVELTETEINENGLAAAFVNEDSSKQIIVSLRDLGVDNLYDLSILARDSIGEGFKYGGFYKLNGLNAIVFMNTERDELTAAISTTEPQYFIQVSILPISDEDMNILSGFILGSIQPYTEE